MSVKCFVASVLLILGGLAAQGQAIQVWLVEDTVYVDQYVGTIHTIEAGTVVYHMYLEMTHTDDAVSTIYGDTINPMVFETTTSFLTDENFGLFPSPFSLDAFASVAPEIWSITYLTISGQDDLCYFQDPISLSPVNNDWIANLVAGESAYVNDVIGGAWSMDFIDSFDCSTAGEDHLLLIGQFTTSGVFSGVINAQTFVHGIQADYSLDLGLEFDPESITQIGCTDSSSPNYNPAAQFDDGSCLPPGDINGDGVLDISDVLDFIADFGCELDCDGSDINGDGIVNILDLLLLLAIFG